MDHCRQLVDWSTVQSARTPRPKSDSGRPSGGFPMVRHSVFTSMFKLVIALLTALVFVGIGGVTVAAGAHDCGCQEDNSGPGSTGQRHQRVRHQRVTAPAGPAPPRAGPADSTTADPATRATTTAGLATADPTTADPATPETTVQWTSRTTRTTRATATTPATAPATAVGPATRPPAPAPWFSAHRPRAAPAQAGAAVPTAVNAGLTGGEESPSALAILVILLGLAMTGAAFVRRRTRA